jgi:streptogramin lyase
VVGRSRGARRAVCGLLLAAAGAGLLACTVPVGTINEFSSGITSGSNPFGVVSGPDGNVWFGEPGGERIGRITPAGTITEFSTAPVSGGTERLAVGADGNVWFTAGQGPYGSLGRITPSGEVTDFTSLLPARSGPNGITEGPDGNIWFTDMTGNRIGRITPSGELTEFSTGISSDSSPCDIAAGPDGNLWFTESYNETARVGRITPTGSVTEFSTGITPGSHPALIAPGPDGAMWFSEASGGQIARITIDGVVTEIPVAGSLANIYGIVPLANGNVWFTDAVNGNRIGMRAPSGQVTWYTKGITAGAVPSDLTLGPDGNLWFAEVDANGIGRLTLLQPSASTTTTTSPS